MTLEARGLAKKIGNFSLTDISLACSPGEVTGIAGANGAGKSTLLKLLSGILRVDSGLVLANGQDILRMTPRERAKSVSILLQETPSPFNFVVEDVVRTAGYFIGKNEDNLDSVLGSMGISELSGRRFHELSGGEKRLVMLAALLYQDSSICLLDEPFSFLDVDKEIRTTRAINQLKKEGKAVVITLHDMNALMRLADHTVLMKRGEIVAKGKTVDILTPENAYLTYGVRFSEYMSPEGKRLIADDLLQI